MTRSFRPRLEGLDDRICLSAYVPTDSFSLNYTQIRYDAAEVAEVVAPAETDADGVGTHGYIRIKKLNSGG